MKLSENGINFIHKFETCQLRAYKALNTEEYYTIGWGHYGPDVSKNMIITKEKADELFSKDIAKFESAVNRLNLKLNQNQFDALVSFTYNCGEGCLKTLVQGRTLEQIAQAILLYNKSGGKIIPGLVRRRNEEKQLFLKSNSSNTLPYDVIVTANALNIRKDAGTDKPILKTVQKGTRLKVWGIKTINTQKWGKSTEGFFNLAYTKKV